MSLQAELRRLRKALADLAPVATTENVRWQMLSHGLEDERAAHWDRHRERCRASALDPHTGRLWVQEHRRLGLPDPTDVPDDVVERLIKMVPLPTVK